MLAIIDQHSVFYERYILMQTIIRYLLGITAAAILCAIVRNLVGSKGTAGAMTKFLTGLFLAITLITPWKDWQDISFGDALVLPFSKGEAVAEEGVQMSRTALAEQVAQQTSKYISERAAYLELSVAVTVSVTEEDIPRPCAVFVQGDASPYAKRMLSQYITQDLGISEEKLIWT